MFNIIGNQFKSWTRLFAHHITQIHLKEAWIKPFSL